MATSWLQSRSRHPSGTRKVEMRSLTFVAISMAAALTAVPASALRDGGQVILQQPSRLPQPPSPPAPPPPPATTPSILQNYKAVDAERLKHPDDGDWLMVRRTYSGWGYSPLEQITPANVTRLQPVWSFSTGVTNGHEAPPIVNNGVMFVATPGNQVIAIDAKRGDQLWRYRNTPAPDVVLLHPTSRGVALYQDKVFFAEAEANLVALDARTGKPVWTAKVEDNRKGYYMSLAPLVADGKVVVGASGGELGVRGFIAAYDVETGKQVWKTFTIPAP